MYSYIHIIHIHTHISLTFNDSKYLRNPNKPKHNRKIPIASIMPTSSINLKEIVSFSNHKKYITISCKACLCIHHSYDNLQTIYSTAYE